jgi:hypothetical protein
LEGAAVVEVERGESRRVGENATVKGVLLLTDGETDRVLREERRVSMAREGREEKEKRT